MLRWLIRSSISARLVVLVIAAGVLAFGAVSVPDARVDVLPEFKPPYVEVQTEALGLSAIEVEQLVTAPLEADLLNGVAYLDEIRSESVAGLSSIQMYFEPGTDVLRARQLVQERLTEARALPNVSRAPAMLQPLSSTGRVMMVGLRSDQLSLIEMSVLARWKIKPRLMGVHGVANVAIFGQRERQLQVQVDPERLRENGVSLRQVVSTTANSLWSSPLSFVEASTPGTGGFIDTPQQRLGIQHVLPITTAEDLAQIALEDTTGRVLTIGQVASVREDHQPLIGDALVQDEPALLLVVEKFPGSDPRDVTRGVEEALQALSPGLPGLQMDTTVYRPASFIESALERLGAKVLVGLVLVALLLGFLLLPWRLAVVSLVSLCLSFTAAVVVLQLVGTTFNALTLVGLVVALVIVVDEAVLTADHVGRRVREARTADSEASLVATVLDASLQVRRPLLPATVAALALAVPVLLVAGLTGSLLEPAAVAYVLATVAALVVAVTVAPALAVTMLTGRGEQRWQPPLATWLHRGYRPLLGRVLRTPIWAWAGVLVGLIALGAVVPALGVDRTVPSMKERDLLVRWDAAPGTSLPEMNRITAAATRDIRAIDGVRNVGAHVGRAISSDQVVGVHSGELWIGIRPSADYGQTLQAVRSTLAGSSVVDFEVMTYSDKRVNELGPDTDEPVVVRVYGEELDQINAKAREVRTALRGIDGAVRPRLSQQPTEPTVEVEVDLARALEFGIKPGDVRRAAATVLSGIQVGNLFEDQKVFDVIVVGVPETRTGVDSIGNLLVDTPSGGHVRLSEVADVRMSAAPVAIKHASVSRYVDVVSGVSGRDVSAVTADLEAALEGIDFPLEYHAEVLDGYAERQADGRTVLMVGGAVLLAALLLIQAFLGSWRLAGALMLTLPLALSGAVLAAWLLSGPLAWSTLLGLGAAFALAVRGILHLTAGVEERARPQAGRVGAEEVAAVAGEKVVAVLASALVSAVALAPFVLVGGGAGDQVIRPLAVVILAGLVTATASTVLVVPAVYLSARPTSQPDTFGSPLEVGLPGQPEQLDIRPEAKDLSDAPL